jgi:hypothetical protein
MQTSKSSGIGCVTRLAVVIAVSITGCGKRGPELVPVNGTITLEGGSWPHPGCIYFTISNPAPGMPGRPAVGKFTANGFLVVTTFKEGDGLIPGDYKIGVECWETPPRMATGAPGKSCVPQRCQSPTTSGLAVSVKPGEKMIHVKLNVTE